MSTDFYQGLREIIRWLEQSDVVSNHQLLARVRSLRSSLPSQSFDHVPGREFLEKLLSELSIPTTIPINKKVVLELLQYVHDLPRLAIESATPEEAVMSSSGTLTIPDALTKADRCDRCSAAAQVRAILPSGGELLFCSHHGRAHRAKLAELNAAVYDDQGRPHAA
jgi:hypothetical protein